MVRHDEADIMLPSYIIHAVVTLGIHNSVRIDGDDVHVDPLLLFQRLITVAQTSDELESAFKHELCIYPPALFGSSLLPREALKLPLLMPYRVLLDITSQQTYQIMPVDVVDGGALIQRIPWSRGSTYGCIFHQYTEYVKHKYIDTIVVFDGYASTNTNDMTYQRRSNGSTGTTVTFTADKPVTKKKEQVLANRQNKISSVSFPC